MKKLQFTKKKLIEWNLESFRKLEEKKKELWAEIQAIDEQGRIPAALMERKNEVLANMEVVLRCEDIHWSQKAKCKWIKEGDGNTNFVHRVANGKNRKNSISRFSIKGEMVEDLDRIKEEVIRFFSSLYTKEESPHPLIDNVFSKSLDQSEAASLEAVFEEDEIKEAIFGMAKDKTLGPDGFFMHFYQECWDIVKEDLLTVFQEFFASGVINLGVNSTFLVLIPKKEDAVSLLDFRPNSLVTSLYKIIAKVFSLRLRKVMGKVVDVTQGAFVKGRQIMDGILIATKCIDRLKKEKKSGLV